MKEERGMPRLQSTPALQEFPQLSRLHFFSTQNQGVIADYFAHLRARHYAPAMQEATLLALKRLSLRIGEILGGRALRASLLDKVLSSRFARNELMRLCFLRWQDERH
jgi:hypothetical protein